MSDIASLGVALDGDAAGNLFCTLTADFRDVFSVPIGSDMADARPRFLMYRDALRWTWVLCNL